MAVAGCSRITSQSAKNLRYYLYKTVHTDIPCIVPLDVPPPPPHPTPASAPAGVEGSVAKMGKRAAALICIAMMQMAAMAPTVTSCGYCPAKRFRTPPPFAFPPPAATTCPIDGLKLGACVDALAGLVHVVVGDPAANQCCPVLSGVLELEAALCLCWAIKLKLLNLDVVLPLALELMVSCGKNPPPGFTCPKS